MPHIEKTYLCLRVILLESLEGAQIGVVNMARTLNLDDDKHVVTVHHKIHFAAGLRAPVGEFCRRIAVTRQRPQVLGDEALQGLPLNVLRTIQWPLRANGAVHTGIKIEELVVGNQVTFGPAGEDGQAERQQQVFQNLQVAFHRLATHLAFARHL